MLIIFYFCSSLPCMSLMGAHFCTTSIFIGSYNSVPAAGLTEAYKYFKLAITFNIWVNKKLLLSIRQSLVYILLKGWHIWSTCECFWYCSLWPVLKNILSIRATGLLEKVPFPGFVSTNLLPVEARVVVTLPKQNQDLILEMYTNSHYFFSAGIQ